MQEIQETFLRALATILEGKEEGRYCRSTSIECLASKSYRKEGKYGMESLQAEVVR